ncbi:LysR family transcriptional regulator [Gorillibacterium timonense]|uniref:LysR family transcriptional regulator n=1 Tax=Gorillibacterium timonense TaxID=1689269 RepID=UPI00071D3880|nr:LysR family transcriptional regulator [Gorillibacterium timonense]
MTEQQIHYFLTLVEEKSFSKAAKRLYVTQPSFSQFIMKIENQLGAKLIDRKSSPVKLTAAGEAYYQAALQTKAIHDNLKNRIADLEDLKYGTLRIGTTPFRGSTLLSKSVYQFHKEYPTVAISIFEGTVEEVSHGVQNGEIDIGIASGEFDEQVFHVEVLSGEKLYLAVPDGNRLSDQLAEYRITADDILHNTLRLLKVPDCSISDFQQESFIVFEQGENITRLTAKLLAEANLQPTISLRTRNLNTVMSFVLAGMGIALIPDSFIKYGNLRLHPSYYSIKSRYVQNEICLIMRKNRYLTKAAMMYSQILKQLISSGTWRVYG